MTMNRRNVLIGLGTIVAGGGAALGTGAFSSVEADREVTLETTGDASALLELEVQSESLQGAAGDGDDVIEINSEDLNLDAVTTFENALRIGNGSDNDNITVAVDDGEVNDEGATVLEEDTEPTYEENDAPEIRFLVNSDQWNGTDEVIELTSGESTEVDIVVNTLGEEDAGENPLDELDSLRFEANEDDDT